MLQIDLTLNKIGGEESFEEVRRYLYKAIHSYWRKYGGEWDEIVSVVYHSFIDAYTKFDDSKGFKFVTWVGYKVDKGLLQHRRIAYREQQRQMVSMEEVPSVADEIAQPAAPTFKLRAFLRSLSEDARVVARLALDRDKPDASEHEQRKYLKQKLTAWGWSKARITETFLEIKDAL